MQKMLLIVAMSITSYSFAITTEEVHQNLGELNNKIYKMNSELSKQHNQQKNLGNALKYSDKAIAQSSILLNQLKQQKNLELTHLHEIKSSLTTLQQNLQTTKTQTNKLIGQLYQQIEQIKTNQQTSIINDNSINNRKKVYLTAILTHQQQQLMTIESKVEQLSNLNQEIESQIQQLDTKLFQAKTEQSKLQTLKQQQLNQAQNIQQNIQTKRDKLQLFKQQQANLNQLMIQINAQANNIKHAASAEQNEAHSENSSLQSNHGKKIPLAANTQFTNPIDAPIALGYGKLRDNVANKGILYKYVENAPIRAVGNGKIVYNGVLSGFGTVVIIDHGNSYLSIYSGVVANRKVNTSVELGEIIASTGNNSNQPLGGFYFEMRHLGKPIDPTNLFSAV